MQLTFALTVMAYQQELSLRAFIPATLKKDSKTKKKCDFFEVT